MAARVPTTVRELIDLLQHVDPNTEVEQESGNYGAATAFIVHLSDEDEESLWGDDDD